MRQLIQLTERELQHKTDNATAPTTTTNAPASSRVPLNTNNNTRQKRSMTLPSPQVPQLSTPSVLRVDQSTKTNHKHRTKKHKNNFQATGPEHNTISQTQAAEAPPESRKRARTQLTKLEKKHKQDTHQQQMRPYYIWKTTSTKLWRSWTQTPESFSVTDNL